jgi:hypothetical protein
MTGFWDCLQKAKSTARTKASSKTKATTGPSTSLRSAQDDRLL